MIEVERNEIRLHIALLERANVLFGRFGTSIPVVIAFLNNWPTPEPYFYWLASFALGRAVSFAKVRLES